MSSHSVALVTGASSGIGLAVANTLHDAGFRVYGTSRRATDQSQFRFTMLMLDVNSDDSVSSAVADLFKREGRLDLLVNNAGFGTEPAAAEESSLDQTRALFETNFMGTVRMCLAVLPLMRAQGHGRIINMGSILGLVSMPYSALYSATKHAVEGYSEALDHEVRSFGIRVSVIEPAYTRTNFEANNVRVDKPETIYDVVRSRVKKNVSTAMQSADTPEEVAAVVLRAAMSSRPRVRYPAGKTASMLYLMRRFLPAALFEKAIRKNIGL